MLGERKEEKEEVREGEKKGENEGRRWKEEVNRKVPRNTVLCLFTPNFVIHMNPLKFGNQI